jgi:hypothetical protein
MILRLKIGYTLNIEVQGLPLLCKLRLLLLDSPFIFTNQCVLFFSLGIKSPLKLLHTVATLIANAPHGHHPGETVLPLHVYAFKVDLKLLSHLLKQGDLV